MSYEEGAWQIVFLCEPTPRIRMRKSLKLSFSGGHILIGTEDNKHKNI